MPDDLTHLVGRRARELRTRAGLTLEGVSERSGLPPETLSRIERGVFSPSVRTLEKLAKGLGVDPIALFWSDPAAPVGLEQVPEKVREIVAELVGRSPDDLMRAKILVFALFAEASRLKDPGPT
jgi:transcriptional regulator with XRE-family HTH domain